MSTDKGEFQVHTMAAGKPKKQTARKKAEPVQVTKVSREALRQARTVTSELHKRGYTEVVYEIRSDGWVYVLNSKPRGRRGKK